MPYSHNPLATWTHTGSSTPHDNETDDDTRGHFHDAYRRDVEEAAKELRERFMPYVERAADLHGEFDLHSLIRGFCDAAGDANEVPLDEMEQSE